MKNSVGITWCCIGMFFILWQNASWAQRQYSPRHRPAKRIPTPDGKGVICRNVDIRNNVESFKKLENCTMIEGFLRILLIEEATQKEYETLSFPDLIEISDYLLLYRVYGLKTLQNIFPNLAVIRGQKLFFDYALVAFEMTDLEELGLTGLITIQRGAVRLEKNSQLCYVNTIDWTKIATQIQGMSGHFFKGNKHHKECVNVCPADCQKTTINGIESRRCWSLDVCQKILTCDSRMTCPSNECDRNTCCHENCVGGCIGPSSSDCVACRNVINVSNKKTICAKQCLPGTYEYRGSQCLEDHECMQRGLKLIKSNHTGSPGLCVLTCPTGYVDSPTENTTCVQCTDQCAKVCPGIRIDSVGAVQDVKGCTIINGPLEIRIRKGTKIAHELEQNVGQIREIRDYLWIHSSNALLALNFFTKLEKIQGRTIHNGYALLIHDNVDLQELFPDEVVSNLQIMNGNILFHYNRKLCLHKILDFENKVKMMANKSKNDISYTTNGDQMPCNVTSLSLNIEFVTSKVALLRWQNFKIPDRRQLLSYVVSYKEAPSKNVSIYQDRDACSDDIWKTRDVLNKNKKADPYVNTLIVNLEPWTQYAVYVQTYTTSSAKFGAISEIVYFRTAPAFPTNPANLKVIPMANGTLLVKWDPPNQPNGNVTHYEVYWNRRKLAPEKFNQRDYCKEPLEGHDQMQLEELEKGDTEEASKAKGNGTDGDPTCSCQESTEEKREETMEREMQIKFENYLHNQVYIKKIDKKTVENLFRNKSKKGSINNATIGQKTSTGSPPSKRYKRETQLVYNVSRENEVSITAEQNTTAEANDTAEVDGYDTNFMKVVVVNRLYIVLSNQGHFKDYNIGVIACQERDPRAPQSRKLCSSRALTVARTLPDKNADNIDPTTIKFYEFKNRTGEVLVTWDEPKDPNGIIITYEIKYSKVLKDVSATTYCITHLQYKKDHGYKVEKLEPGNYSVQIRATSLAGPGNYTEPRYFKVSSPPGPREWPKETIIAVAVSGVLLLIVVAVIIVWFVARSRFGRIPETVLNISANPDYFHPDEVYVPDEWEVERDTIKLIRELGQGSFGMVYEGIAHHLFGKDNEIKVAVKTVNENASFTEKMSFLNEASTMKAFKCNHVVRLLGVVSQGQPAYVVMELMTNGDLKNFLRMHRPDEEDMDSMFAGLKPGGSHAPPTLNQTIQMAAEIADGMAYLADKKYVHRDLAARNCMVAEDLTVKIGDFGMTRDIYETDYYRKGGKALLPVRWMAPESLKDGIFTSLSDVWSYGVVLWEMATLAAQPYQGLSNEEVLKYVLNGKIMDKPEGCPDRLFDLMLHCWRYKPKQRPTFKEIIEMLVPELDPSFKEVSYFFSDENKQDTIDVPEDFDEELQDDSHIPFIQNNGSDSEAATGGRLTLSEDIDLEDDPGIVDNFEMYNSPPRYNNDNNHFNSFELGRLSPHNHFVNEKMFDRLKNKDPGYSSEHCECVLMHEPNHNTDHNHRFSSCSNPNSAIGSSDGSKDSSKSSGSSHAQRNGFNTSIANGHVPIHHPMRSAKC